MRRVVRERYDFTDNPRDRLRRGQVHRQVAGWVGRPVSNVLAKLVRWAAEEAGAVSIASGGPFWFTKMRERDAELIPGAGQKASDVRRAWWARMQREGDIESPNGRLKELPHWRDYRREINQAFFERAIADYWRQREELQAWGLYALEGLSIRDIEERTGLGRDRIHRIVKARRAAMGIGQQEGDEEAND